MDMEVFDPLAFFDQRIGELEEEIDAKRVRAEILSANRANIERTLVQLAVLESEYQRALQMEITSLTEALDSSKRTLEALVAEIDLLHLKLNALRAGQALMLEEVARPA